MTFKFLKPIFCLGLASFLWSSCSTKEDTKPTVTLPVLAATKSVTDITETTALSGGNITSTGGADVTARGVCYGKTSSPTLEVNSVTTDGTGSGEFSSFLAGLEPATKYYVRAYGTNSKGTAYGTQVSFTTLVVNNLPVISATTAASGITGTSVISGGSITGDGGSAITHRGVCWSKTGTPTISSLKTLDGTGTGTFTSSLTGLSVATNYNARAYATNANGTSYGPQISFTTANVVVSIPVLGATNAISSIQQTSANSGGTITSDGNGSITAHGLCWSTSANPTIGNSKSDEGAGTAGSFTSAITGLTASTLYYVRAYATNSAGTGYGTQVSFTTKPLTVTDANGHVYQTVKIGSQTWMTSNLKVDKLNNNGSITHVSSSSDWTTYPGPLESYYDNSAPNYESFGLLYNFACVESGKLCPVGWHVPTDSEWQTLETYLGMPGSSVNLTGWRGGPEGIGNKLKTTSTWSPNNGSATNSSGFSALPGGERYYFTGGFQGLYSAGHFWTSTPSSSTEAWGRKMEGIENGIERESYHNKRGGKSVRCIMN